jgi:methylphosphotriester-DNA--protein-cysteine methyltransferase
MFKLPIDFKFYGVKTTKIFCRSDCPSKTPKSENVVFFKDSTTAIKQGFRECKRCRPLRGKSLPSKVMRKSLVKDARDLVIANNGIQIQEICNVLHISERHLRRVFHEETSTTPSKFLRKFR